ncbi:bifunctional riboflavin kinase/FAD synthetase [Clostridium sp. 'White wine YQ']|uniref:bifunctional riboflavin kinase/FAD synthetase n=1 Tax=Clostridium sp. 'White wine YQ' TaxID=3027474 RepID=UPI002366081F|nr:bifunctional riboflavin kinase/FAD synthetase [Clostridium sp. 'White wine YQ']MDD7793800.1 bifunctional riboflavin kinase/FAD synthetase [Clostridium sp. 'White wine YQ']
MIIINEINNEAIKEDTYIALGSFDGLHKGHLTLINKARELANANNGKSMVFSFKNHPLSLIRPELAPKLLMSNEEKVKILSDLKIDIFTLVDFNESFMKIEPEDFISLLCTKYNAKGIVVGFNYRFGYKNKGNIELLKSLEGKYNFKLHILDAYTYKDEIVSSSRIREEISSGNIEDANEMLSRAYYIQGKVIHGKKLGRQLGFPTANLEYSSDFILPKIGVYYTNVVINEKQYKGITSVGYNPTVKGENLTVETYILDFDEDIYDKILKVYFIKRIRDEENFASLDELIAQLNSDKEFAVKESLSINL